MRRDQAIAGVLIGGQSRRMGSNKALLRFHGRTFAERIVDAARSVLDEVVLLGSADVDAPALADMVRLDDEPSFAGPLAGLVPLLAHARDRWALLIACDMPLIEPRILQRLVDACDDAVDAVAYRVVEGDAGYHPCCVAFHPRTVSAARGELSRSASLRELIATVRCRVLETDASDARCLRNFNTLADYAGLVASSENFLAAGGSSG